MQAKSNESAVARDKWPGRWMFLLLVVFFSVPLLAVVLMHQYNWHPQSRSHGDLVTPPVPLNVPGKLMNAQGIYVDPELLKDKWSMVYIAHDCEATCAERLHVMRQLHASLAKDIKRVQRVLIVNEDDVREIHQQYPDLLIFNQPEPELAALRQQFDLQDQPPGSDRRIYLVDPLGNLMMSFPESIPAADIRKDMIRLLAYSWAG